MQTPQQINEARAQLGMAPVAPLKSPQEVNSLRGNDLAAYFQGLKAEKQSKPDIGSTVSEYVKGWTSVPENLMAEYDQSVARGKEAITHGAGLMSDPTKSAGQRTAGLAEAGLGTVTPTLQAVFAPFTAVNKAIIPGEGFASQVGRGALTGAEIAALASAPTGGLASPITIPIGATVAAGTTAAMYGLNKIKQIPEVAQYIQEHPEVERIVEGALALSAVAFGSKKTDVMNTPVKDIPGNVSANVSATAQPVMNAIGTATNAIGSKIAGTVDDLSTRIKTFAAQKHLDPQTQASAERLVQRQGIGKTKMQDPVAQYDDFVNQEKLFKADIKQDTALGKVGQEIGDDFDKVIEMRRDVGAAMGQEMKRLGKTKADVTPARANLEQNLRDSGVEIDPMVSKVSKMTPDQRAIAEATGQAPTSKNVLSVTDSSRIAKQDMRLLETYTKDFLALGDKPTLSQIDSFISRISNEMKLYKNKNNVTGTTNGMRIIQGSLDDLRQQLSPEATGNPQLATYADARKIYAELSEFIDEGSKFMGKKNASGEFVRDASVAKSAVQSILNSGKKDWLQQLENLTGNPLLDKTVLALQAMKDSGNFRGLSLLETLSQGADDGIPTSAAGIRSQLTDWATKVGKKAILGDQVEQTRTFLKSLNEKSGGELSQSAAAQSLTKSTIPNTKVNDTVPVAPKTGSIENLIETHDGWQPGMRKVFDTALLHKDKATLQKILPQAPHDYVLEFADQIKKILGK